MKRAGLFTYPWDYADEGVDALVDRICDLGITRVLVASVYHAGYFLHPHNPRRKTQRVILEGDVPSPINPPSGCRFHTRCAYAVPACSEHTPTLAQIEPGHMAACIRISPAEPDIDQVAPGKTPGLG